MNCLNELKYQESVEILLKEACKLLFNEEVAVYVEDKDYYKTYEVHFSDSNYFKLMYLRI